MKVVFVALHRNAHSSSVIGVFTSATDAHESTRKLPRAWFEPCRLHGMTEFGKALLPAVRQSQGISDGVWRSVGLESTCPRTGASAAVSSTSRSSAEAPSAAEPKISERGTGAGEAACFTSAR